MSVTCHLQGQDVLPAVIPDLEDARLHTRLRLLPFCVSLLDLHALEVTIISIHMFQALLQVQVQARASSSTECPARVILR